MKKPDLVEVIRCKDCKHRGFAGECPMCYTEAFYDGDLICDGGYVDVTVNEGFCHCGEKVGCGGGRMKKLFISQPMNGYSDEAIKEKRGEAITRAAVKLCSPVKVIDSFFEGVAHDEKPMWYLGESIKKLAEADAAYFAKGWQNSRGCRIEHEAAVAYGIEVIYE